MRKEKKKKVARDFSYPTEKYDPNSKPADVSAEKWEERCKLHQLELTDSAMKQVAKLTGGQTTDFNEVQLFWLAMQGYRPYGDHAREVYIALHKAGVWMVFHTSTWQPIYDKLRKEKEERQRQREQAQERTGK